MELFNECRGILCATCGFSALQSRLFWLLYNYSSGATLHWNKGDCPTHERLHAQVDEIDGSVGFVQLYSVIAADVLIGIGTALISAIR
jgi:hypothetical protein